MHNRNLNILIWNVRGINDQAKWLAIANKIAKSNCDIICLQETKRESFDSQYIKNFYPRKLNKFVFLPSMGATGGLFIGWNGNMFMGNTLFQNDYSISGDSWILTNIYAPCQGDARDDFIQWFKNIDMADNTDWLVVGDFNFMRYPDNRNMTGGNVQDMLSYNEAINAQALVEIPLKGRSFTWSNMQQAPLLEKLDWAFSSESWTLQYPKTLAIPLAKPISDHCPYVIQVGTNIPKSSIFRFEYYWLNHHDFKEIVRQIWN